MLVVTVRARPGSSVLIGLERGSHEQTDAALRHLENTAGGVFEAASVDLVAPGFLELSQLHGFTTEWAGTDGLHAALEER